MQIAVSWDDFHRIPRHPDWRWEYYDGCAQLSWRPKWISLRRDVALPVEASDREQREPPLEVRLIDPAADRDGVSGFLLSVWRHEDPFRYSDDEQATEWLNNDLGSSFGRLHDPAGVMCFENGEMIGAVLLERTEQDAGHPSLSWLAVRWGHRQDGVATAMLAAVIDELRHHGIPELHSDVTAANLPSAAWHWRRGFEALPDKFASHTLGRRGRRPLS